MPFEEIESVKGRDKLRDFYEKITETTRKEYPKIMEEIEELARRVGFKDVLINTLLQATAEVDPDKPDEVVWARKSIENINILKNFAPEFSSDGIRIVTIHEKEHLRGPAKTLIGAEEKFLGNEQPEDYIGFGEKALRMKKIYLFREHQTRLQSVAQLEKYKKLFKDGEYPDIAKAIAIEEIFVDFTMHGPGCLSQEVSMDEWQEYLRYFNQEFIETVARKDKETREKLLKDYQSWREKQK